MWTTYDYGEAVFEAHAKVQNKKTRKIFYMCYKSNYFLGKALGKIERSNDLLLLSHNYKRY